MFARFQDLYKYNEYTTVRHAPSSTRSAFCILQFMNATSAGRRSTNHVHAISITVWSHRIDHSLQLVAVVGPLGNDAIVYSRIDCGRVASDTSHIYLQFTNLYYTHINRNNKYSAASSLQSFCVKGKRENRREGEREREWERDVECAFTAFTIFTCAHNVNITWTQIGSSSYVAFSHLYAQFSTENDRPNAHRYGVLCEFYLRAT